MSIIRTRYASASKNNSNNGRDIIERSDTSEGCDRSDISDKGDTNYSSNSNDISDSSDHSLYVFFSH